jgi:SAM-dependent methyltransferase
MPRGVGAFTQATGRSLERDAEQPNYREFQRSLIAPHCGASVLEVGAGLGEFSAQLTGLERLVVTDVDPGGLQVLRRRFAGRPEVEVRRLDLDRDGDLRLDPPVASVVAINVLEHLDDDVGALRALRRLTVGGGTVILWVPGYQQLYGEFDRLVGHVRRYTPASLRAACVRAGLEVSVVRPVNLLGALAWWLAVRHGGTRSPRPGLVRLYDRVVVPVTRRVEAVVRPPFGQSILCVARTPAER